MRVASAWWAGLGLAMAARAMTLVPGGLLTTDTQWTLAGSPYVLHGQVVVASALNPRLTIEAGVEVRESSEKSGPDGAMKPAKWPSPTDS